MIENRDRGNEENGISKDKCKQQQQRLNFTLMKIYYHPKIWTFSFDGR